MTKHRRGPAMSPELQKVAERAKKDPGARFNSLAHLLDEEALKRAFGRIRKKAAVGIDGIDKEAYGANLDENIRALHERLASKRYRHQPIRRVNIPKGRGKTRPIGISTVEDKIVQGALREVLEAIYEQEFKGCSYGFRPGRGAHDALGAVDRMAFREGVEWILEADIQSFFDSIDRTKLREMLQLRVADGSLMRLVGKCLHVGVLDGGEFTTPGRRGDGGTFDFLGFTLLWQRARSGGWRLGMKTRKARIQRFLRNVSEWCRRYRHLPRRDQYAALYRRLRGHYAYYGVNGNIRALHQVQHAVERIWHKWLRRRSQRSRLPWERFKRYLEVFPLLRPRICVQIWSRAP